MADVAADIDEVSLIGLAVFGVGGEGDDVEPFAVAGDGHEFLEVGELLGVLFSPGEEIEVGVGGFVPGEFAVGVGLEVLFLEEGGDGLVDGVADVEAGGVLAKYGGYFRGKTYMYCNDPSILSSANVTVTWLAAYSPLPVSVIIRTEARYRNNLSRRMGSAPGCLATKSSTLREPSVAASALKSPRSTPTLATLTSRPALKKRSMVSLGVSMFSAAPRRLSWSLRRERSSMWEAVPLRGSMMEVIVVVLLGFVDL